MNDNKNDLKLKLIFIESTLTNSSFGLCMPIMTVFWNSIGMNQTLIGLSQMICTLAMLVFDIPMGYIADKFDRKKLNIIGDFGIIITFLIYMFAHSFIVVVIAETLCGIFTAMTNGVDNAFMKFYSDKIDDTGNLFKKNIAKLSICQSVGFVASILIGMVISKYNLRLAVGSLVVPFIIGTTLSLFIDDIGARIEPKHISTAKEFISNLKYILKGKETRWLVLAWSVMDNITRAIVWVLSPILILIGVPIYIVGIGWLLNNIASIFGSIFAKKIQNIEISKKFALHILLVILGTLPIIITPNIWTVWLFALTGFASGLPKTLFMPVIQEKNKDKYQTTVVSITTTVARLVYLPSVYLINMSEILNHKTL